MKGKQTPEPKGTKSKEKIPQVPVRTMTMHYHLVKSMKKTLAIAGSGLSAQKRARPEKYRG